MRYSRLSTVLAALLIVAFVMTGCSARPGAGELAQAAATSQLAVDLPAVNIDYNDQGEASISGVGVAALGTLLGTDLSSLNRTPDQMAKLKAAGIQQVFINITPAGLGIFANGQPMLQLAWTAEGIDALGKVLAGLGNPSLAKVEQMLPLLKTMSLGIVMNFPGAGGDKAPLVAPVDKAALAANVKTEASAALTALGVPPLFAPMLGNLPAMQINYAADGNFEIKGLAPLILSQIPPSAMNALKLPPDMLQKIHDAKIQSLGLKTAPEGLTIAVNGTALPTLQWDSGELQNLAKLGIDGGALSVVPGLDTNSLAPLAQIAQIAPVLQTTKLDLTLNFAQ